MCLLLKHPAGLTLPDDLVNGVYKRNADGVGVMWAQDGQLHLRKTLPRTQAEALQFYREHVAGKDCVVHWRMATHGHTDLDNCHPYKVFGFDDSGTAPLLLMHNGVLSTGNARNPAKSDTWHYIRTYLRPMLKGNPGWVFTQEFADMVGKHIGSNNRLALMDAAGQVQVVNKSTGVEYEGAWFSNTYAWDSSRYLPRGRQLPWGRGNWTKADDDAYDSYMASRQTVIWPERVGKKAHKVASPKRVKAGAASRLTGPMTTHVKASGKEPALDPQHLDDVVEIRSMLDVVHPTCAVKDSQLQSLLEWVGATKAFFAVELLFDGRLQTSRFDALCTSPTAAREFARIDAAAWDGVPKGSHGPYVEDLEAA